MRYYTCGSITEEEGWKFGLILFTVVCGALMSAPAAAGVKAVIDKSEQRMYVWENGTLTYTWAASTGKKSTYTPTGTFHPYKQIRHHISSTYGKPMAFAVYYKDT